MKDKIKNLIQSHFGHVVIAFILYCLFISAILFSFRFLTDSKGLDYFAQTTEAELLANSNNKIINDSRHIKIAIIATELGLSKQNTEKAIKELPNSVSFAFSPYAENLTYWFSEAKKFNHEILLEIPMEPINYPDNDAGPIALLTRYSATRNTELLKDILDKAYGYDGVITWLGGKFMSSKEDVAVVFEHISKMGLFFVDTTQNKDVDILSLASTKNLPYISTNIEIDKIATKEYIISKLNKLETMAKIGNGYAIGIIHNYPISIDMIKEWSKELKKKNIDIVPVSILINK